VVFWNKIRLYLLSPWDECNNASTWWHSKLSFSHFSWINKRLTGAISLSYRLLVIHYFNFTPINTWHLIITKKNIWNFCITKNNKKQNLHKKTKKHDISMTVLSNGSLKHLPAISNGMFISKTFVSFLLLSSRCQYKTTWSKLHVWLCFLSW